MYPRAPECQALKMTLLNRLAGLMEMSNRHFEELQYRPFARHVLHWLGRAASAAIAGSLQAYLRL